MAMKPALDYETPPPPPKKPPFWPRRPTRRETVHFLVVASFCIIVVMVSDKLKAIGWSLWERYLLIGVVCVGAIILVRLIEAKS
jgi:hypothetical protein